MALVRGVCHRAIVAGSAMSGKIPAFFWISTLQAMR
jgi:hypothetical protein